MVTEEEPKHLTQIDFHRRHLHDAIDTIIDAWPRASEDVDAIGFPSAVMQPSSGGTAELTSVEAAALRGINFGDAVAWIAELHDTTRRVLTAAWPSRTVKPAWTAEQLRPVLHQAVDVICQTWTVDDLVDFDPASSNHRSDVFGLGRLAGTARRWWPATPKAGTTQDGVTVGQRGNTVETCTACQLPIGGGRNDPLKRIDGDPFHVKNPAGVWCYHQALRSRGRLGSQRRGA